MRQWACHSLPKNALFKKICLEQLSRNRSTAILVVVHDDDDDKYDLQTYVPDSLVLAQ